MRNKISLDSPKQRIGDSGRCAGGFTLIELLVVISIIALLVSILLPALSRARESAKDVVCKSNMKQIGLALYYYCDDNGDVMITEDAALTTLDSGGNMHSLPWQAILLPYIGHKVPDLSTQWKVEGLYRVFECPSQKDKWDWFDNASMRYGINTKYCSHYTIKSGNVAFDALKKDSIRNPDRRMYVSDTLDDSADRARQFIDSGTLAPTRNWLMSTALFNFSWDSPPSDRHNGRSNLLYVDGHIDHLVYEQIMPYNGIDIDNPTLCASIMDLWGIKF